MKKNIDNHVVIFISSLNKSQSFLVKQFSVEKIKHMKIIKMKIFISFIFSHGAQCIIKVHMQKSNQQLKISRDLPY